MMSDYIKREKALEIVKRTSGDYAAAWSEIAHAETEDVSPVVHGKWIKDIPIGYRCSVVFCQCLTVNKTNYCPNCGARMDG